MGLHKTVTEWGPGQDNTDSADGTLVA